eukprot:NODE_656_length_4979_cov_1.014754.p4 type:complete len:196 gc:universal NODE_656_length_4979_cov_1.014754:964-1551(+)
MKLPLNKRIKSYFLKYPKLKYFVGTFVLVSLILIIVLPLTVTPKPNLNQIYFTFYGFDDNDDGKHHYGTSKISDPTIHQVATEDLGTYDNPSTFAGDEKYRLTKAGQRIYVPRLKKYYIMEDTCVECTADQNRGKLRIDLYIGGNTALQNPALKDCQSKLTVDKPYTETVIIDPPNNLAVDTKPLFSSDGCYVPS